MAVITLTIPDALLSRATKALSAAVGLDPSAANAKQALANYIISTTKQYEQTQALIAAAQTLPADITVT